MTAVASKPSSDTGELMLTAEQLAGRTLDGRYRLDRVLATGGMGVVCVGTDLRTNRHVAVKLLKPHSGIDEGSVRRFFREVEIAGRLRHPHIVDVLDLGTLADGRAPYLVMELLTGRTLGAELDERGTLPVDETLELLLPVIGALGRVHAAGVIHRDVKPGNIFLHRDDYGRTTAKLLDFGIAKSEDGGTETSSSILMGTPAYMAPEQLANRPAGAATDVWAMGAVLYACLSGRPPLVGATSAETIAKIATEPAPPLVAAGVHRGILAAVDRALLRDPASRYPSMAAFSAALLDGARAAGIDVAVPPSLAAVAQSAADDATEPRPRLEALEPVMETGPVPVRAATAGERRRGARRRGRWAAGLFAVLALGATAVALTWPRPELGSSPAMSDERRADDAPGPRFMPRVSLPASPVPAPSASKGTDGEGAQAIGSATPPPSATVRSERRSTARTGGRTVRKVPAVKPRERTSDLPVAVEW